MLISYAQDAGNFAHDRATLCEKHLVHAPKTFDDAAGSGRKRLTFMNVPLGAATAYAAEGADVTLYGYGSVSKPEMLRVNKSLALYELMEKPLIPVLHDMEFYGVMVDRAELTAMSADFAKRMEEIEADIHRLASQKFNVGSPKQLGEILFETLPTPAAKEQDRGLGHRIPRCWKRWPKPGMTSRSA